MREAPNIVPHEVLLASTLLTGVLSRLQNGPKLRTRSAVAQRGIFRAEGSFRLCAFKNGLHKTLMSSFFNETKSSNEVSRF